MRERSAAPGGRRSIADGGSSVEARERLRVLAESRAAAVPRRSGRSRSTSGAQHVPPISPRPAARMSRPRRGPSRVERCERADRGGGLLQRHVARRARRRQGTVERAGRTRRSQREQLGPAERQERARDLRRVEPVAALGDGERLLGELDPGAQAALGDLHDREVARGRRARGTPGSPNARLRHAPPGGGVPRQGRRSVQTSVAPEQQQHEGRLLARAGSRTRTRPRAVATSSAMRSAALEVAVEAGAQQRDDAELLGQTARIGSSASSDAHRARGSGRRPTMSPASRWIAASATATPGLALDELGRNALEQRAAATCARPARNASIQCSATRSAAKRQSWALIACAIASAPCPLSASQRPRDRAARGAPAA